MRSRGLSVGETALLGMVPPAPRPLQNPNSPAQGRVFSGFRDGCSHTRTNSRVFIRCQALCWTFLAIISFHCHNNSMA